MSDGTKIEWTDATVNAVNGCSVLSPGCKHCYAMRLAGTRLKHHPSRAGLTIDTKAGPVWTGEVRLNEKALLEPLRWRRGRKIFWDAHGDLFHENVPVEWIDRQLAVCALTPQHQHQILTKRSARMREYFADPKRAALIAYQARQISPGIVESKNLIPLPNVWLGVSVEDQQRADERIPDLLETPAAVRFLSCEPLLGPLDLHRYLFVGPEGGIEWAGARRMMLHWVIVGGESGPDARPMHPDWARSLRDQCGAAGVPFHFKQWGPWRVVPADQLAYPHRDARIVDGVLMQRIEKTIAGRLLDGVEHDGFPQVAA